MPKIMLAQSAKAYLWAVVVRSSGWTWSYSWRNPCKLIVCLRNNHSSGQLIKLVCTKTLFFFFFFIWKTYHRRARRNHRSYIWTEALFAMVNQGSPLVPFYWLVYKVVFLTWIATTWHGGHVGGQYIKNSFPRNHEFSWG